MVNEKTVLVVDDDPNILSAFGDFFRKEECRMIASSSMEEALEILKESSSVNLIITDIRLKGRSGVTFLLEVKRIWQDLPVIVISGYPDVITENDLQKYGADYFFVKPLDLEKLREAVRECLHRIPRKS